MDERGLFIAAYDADEACMAELCRMFGISRKTGYKWIARYEADGLLGLGDRSHAPLSCPHRVSDDVVSRILALRHLHPSWGPKKLKAYLMAREPRTPWPAASTMGDLIVAAGLSVPRRKRIRVPLASAPLAHAVAPNDVWTADFKGWFRTGDGRRCDPFTLSDAASRYLLRCQSVARADSAHVWPILDAALREFGAPRLFRSDNGAPFASRGAGGLTRLSVKLIQAGVTPERIAPGKPQENGRHERMHLTLSQDTAQPPAATLRAQQRRFDDFRRVYNDERPHEALGQETPSTQYAPSSRRYSGRLRAPDYPADCEVRQVRRKGEIKWRGGYVFLNEALAGQPVALRETDNGHWRVDYGPVHLGCIEHDGKLKRPGPRPRTRARAPKTQHPPE